MERTYKDLFIERNGKAAYEMKLAKNAAWRKANPEKAEEYALKRSKKGSDRKGKILFIGDVHMGSKTTNIDQIKRLAKKYWSSSPVILMGDLVDMGMKKLMIFQNTLAPQDQIDLVAEIFQPLDIRMYCIGNHEDRIFKEVGLNPYISMFKMEPANTLKIGGREIYINHGTSAAESAFLEHSKYARWVSGDVIALGHSHLLAKKTVLRQKKITHFIRTGGFIGDEYYVVKAGYWPQLKGWAEYDLERNIVHLKAFDPDTEEVFNI